MTYTFSNDKMVLEPMTALEIATILACRAGLPEPRTGAEFAAVGIPILGGCFRCGAQLAAYNAHPQHNGYWACLDCSEQPIVTMDEWERVTGADEVESDGDSSSEPS